jgi:glycosyltransferase involved in cell wall biosynthesis
MKLLICTQIVDSQDSNLGFFHRWIEEFAHHCEKVIVVCLKEGEHSLPPNVTVLSLGKENNSSRMTRAFLFFKYIYHYRRQYDAVFVHMNPEYVLLGGYLWRKWHKKSGLWYAHRSVTRKLIRAVSLVDRIFTVAQDSFQVATPKLLPLGHGIDTELFKPEMHLESTDVRMVTVGRIAASKHIIEMLQVLDVLHARDENFTFTIVGDATSAAEREYANLLKAEIAKRPYSDKVLMRGAVVHHDLPDLLREQDIALNFSDTGNMDKAGLEALAVGIPLFSTNTNFKELLEPFGLYAPMDPTSAAEVLQHFLNRPDRPAIVSTLRNKVVAEHSLERLIPKILHELA